jgi:MinD-like ATPase involved in chromosome partitioning or flagellar assembly
VLIAIGAAKGSPGVTTTVTAMGTVWPNDVLVADCDPAGGDLALRHRDPHGSPLDPERGLLSLAAAARRGLEPAEIDQHVQTVDGGLDVIAGVANPEQVTGIGPVWPTVAGALRDSVTADVLADCGRIIPGTPVLPVLTAADAVVMCVRPTVESYAHLRERLRWLAGPLRIGELGSVPVGVVVIAPVKDTAVARDLDRLLQHEGLQVSVIGRIADDTKAADTLAGRRTSRLAGSLLVRSAREVAGAAVGLARHRPPVDSPAV